MGILALSPYPTEPKDTSPQSPLRFVTIAKDNEFEYVFQIYPSKKSQILYIWTTGIKESSTGKIVSKQTAQTMRGQENELHLKYHRDGSLIKITLLIHTKQPKLLYTIERTKGDQVVYRCKGETKVENI